jgi:hypothetical protein
LRGTLCDLAAQSKRLSLVIHYYSDGVETEAFGILGKKKVGCAELLNDDWAIEEDKVIELK